MILDADLRQELLELRLVSGYSTLVTNYVAMNTWL